MGRTLMLSAVLLSGCYYDMRLETWRKAEEVCAQFGGVKAADELALEGGGYRVYALCANGSTVTATVK